MALVRTFPPDTLTLYTSHPTPRDILDRIAQDFSLAAHEGYNPVVRLSIDSREDFFGRSPEEVLQVLEQEQGDGEERVQFLLVTKETVNRGGVGLWYVHEWPKEEMVEGLEVVESAKGKRFAEKLWIQAYYAPILWANLSIGNLSIPERWPRPYDPFTVPSTAYDANCDWRLRPPDVAYVLALPEAYEVSDSAQGQAIMRLGSGGTGGVKFYRLSQGWAETLRLERGWHPGWPFRRANAREGEWERLVTLGLKEGDEDKVATFAQRWIWTAPEV